MQRLGLSYYAGLLSAAQYHGAAHHRPQDFQIMVAKARRPIRCGKVRVAFVVRKNIGEVSVQNFSTPRGTIRVSTPEATAVDLVGYHHHAGGLDQVAPVLPERAEGIDPEKLVAAAQSAPLPWVQRLGYLLDRVDAADKTASFRAYVGSMARQTVPLLPGISDKNAPRDRHWKLGIC